MRTIRIYNVSHQITFTERLTMKTDTVWDESTQEYVMPCAEAVLMATLALMTGHSQNTNEQHLQWMACKIGANLEVLASHPSLSDGFKKALAHLVAAWAKQPLADASSCPKAWETARLLPAVNVVH